MIDYSADELLRDYPFARPSFIEGMGRMLDLSGSLNTYNYAGNGAEADARAIGTDWKAIGRDVRAALEQLRGSRK